MENLEYLNDLGSLITKDARCTQEIKSRIFMDKAQLNRKKTLFTSKMDLNIRQKLLNCCIWNIAVYGAETCTLRELDQKYPEIVETWCWRSMDKIGLTDHVRSKEISQRVKEDKNILHEISKRTAN